MDAVCPKCGQPLPPDTSQGLCPTCQLHAGLDSELQAWADPTATVALGPGQQQTAAATDDTKTLLDPSDVSRASGATGRSPPGYDILEELGRGGMGVVYKARQTRLNRLVALKMILAGAHAGSAELARFKTEAEAIARLQHPNIVQVYEVSEHDGKPFLALEFCPGGGLDSKIDGTPLPAREAAQLVQTLARAMHAAHQQNVIHRDLKPANVLLAADGTPKITDFGLAKMLDDQGQTASNATMGTPSYMAPEQAGQARQVGPAADIYALGAILYEMLGGRPPFKAATILETLRQVVSDEPVPLTQLQPKTSKDLETICLKCLQKDPKRRYESAAALAEDLERFLRGEPIKARPVSWAEWLWRWCKRHPTRAAGAAAALLALLVVLIGGAWFNRRLAEQVRQTEAAHRQLQTALARQAAERLDSDLLQLAAVPRLMAVTLSQRPDWTDKQLDEWMRGALYLNPRIFGICAAFEPHQFDPTQKDFALYVCRRSGGFETKRLAANYRPHYREWPWYRWPLERRQAVWSEPFLDKGGGDVEMLTYSVPLLRQGKLVGVVTADLSRDYFQVLRQWLADLRLPQDGYAFVISPTGTFISHPDPRFQTPHKITDFPEFEEDKNLRELARRMLNQENGRVTAVDPATGKPSAFLFAPVPSTRWSLAVVVEE